MSQGRDLDVAPGSVHVWRVSLDPDLPSDGWDGWSTLSPDEQARADGFVFDADRRRFIGARVVLRRLLAAHVDRSPGEVRFDEEGQGKPVLANGVGRGLHFNSSRSGSLLLIAIGRGFPLGIDVETTAALPDRDALAERFFAPTEYQRLMALSADRRDYGFLQCWTRKEAFVKAIGDGLTHPLDRFEVAFGDEAPRLVHIDGDPVEAARWALVDLPVGNGAVAALAVRAPAPDVECRDLDA